MNRKIYLIGLSHKTASVDVRGQFALTDIDNFEQRLAQADIIQECFILSTCNRVEIVVVVQGAQDAAVFDTVYSLWAEACKGPVEHLLKYTYQLNGLEAVKHLFTVACSLDSLVMGEPQILGQLKDAYRSAVECGTARTIINRLLHKAFSTAKRVRTETGIASSAVSISFAAVELAKKIFGDLTECNAMLIGAGEMAELAATHLMNNGVQSLLIANRTYPRAKALAATMGGQPIQFEEMLFNLHKVDMVISSTGSSTAILKAKEIRDVLKKRKHKPMFFIDIAVPRDIDPDVNNLDNVYLYDIDDLKEVVEENISQRKEEAVKAHSLVAVETEKFGMWLKALTLQPTIADMISASEDIAQQELEKTLKRLGNVDAQTRDALEILVRSVSRKVLHEPICYLKRRSQEEAVVDRFIDITRKMFNLDGESIPATAHLDRKLVSNTCSSEELESFIEAAKKEQL